MRILTWSLKEGDEVEVVSPMEITKKIVKIQRGPYQKSSYGFLWIDTEDKKCAFWSDRKQKWVCYT